MGRKLGDVPLWGVELGPHLTQCHLDQDVSPYQVASWSVQPFHHKTCPTTGGRGLCPLFWVGAGSPSNTMWPGPTGRGLPLYQVASWSTQPFGHNTSAGNWGLLCPLLGERAGSLSNRIWPGPRHISMPGFILIHPTVWPQYTNVTNRTGQTTVW